MIGHNTSERSFDERAVGFVAGTLVCIISRLIDFEFSNKTIKLLFRFRCSSELGEMRNNPKPLRDSIQFHA